MHRGRNHSRFPLTPPPATWRTPSVSSSRPPAAASSLRQLVSPTATRSPYRPHQPETDTPSVADKRTAQALRSGASPPASMVT